MKEALIIRFERLCGMEKLQALLAHLLAALSEQRTLLRSFCVNQQGADQKVQRNPLN
jgi:hypothetical protein